MTEMRRISREALKGILDEHAKWMKGDHKQGKRADLSGADLSFANLSGADLSRANLRAANLFVAHLIRTNLNGANLNKANLRRANLRGADLRGADLNGADLNGAGLFGADLFRADLSGANLSGANLIEADLREANLSGADLCRAVLNWANLSEANLSGANLGEARCGKTNFTDIDLREAKGLESIVHADPSSVGVDTLFKSKGEIPRVFLEGCGIPEPLIQYLPSLVNALDLYPYYTCFISYAEPDEEFSRRLYEDLKARKIRCWRWREDATWGRSLRGEIDRAVRQYDKLIVICSRDSLDRVPVQREIQRALQKEVREDRDVLFPITIDDYLLSEWDHALKADLLEKVIGKFPMFGRGKAYEEAIERLVEGLKRVSGKDG